ncbi:At2g23090 like protein [Polychytrium aggregatum]|uniref:At2g23090 like protein n=1 Tax=Polychytrium aggregatum TaxID=110093 RepID=UPI0022FDF08D|nr:At2g23090 like protein [Polychytrium aggregatum]KAI9208806.1 At2g23090 like protein [Polychytrium aggregatum]
MVGWAPSSRRALATREDTERTLREHRESTESPSAVGDTAVARVFCSSAQNPACLCPHQLANPLTHPPTHRPADPPTSPPILPATYHQLDNMGNGQKAAMRRDRAAKDSKTAKSQLKTNEAAKNIMCSICRQTFLMTIREQALQDHIESKHSGKTVKECFPMWGSA